MANTQIFDNLPKDLVEIIAHQQIRNDLLASLAYDISEYSKQSAVAEIYKKNLVVKCQSFLGEWMASKSPKIYPMINFGDYFSVSVQIVENLLKEKNRFGGVYAELTEKAYTFQQEMISKYARQR